MPKNKRFNYGLSNVDKIVLPTNALADDDDDIHVDHATARKKFKAGPPATK
jgi:hypothetical protein